jgi:hypothetical protein
MERGRQTRRVQQGGAVAEQFGGEGSRDLRWAVLLVKVI